MIKPERIPDEVVKVLTMLLLGHSLNDKNVSIAIAAAINAWPDVRHSIERNGSYPVLILPLTQEPST
jgi:hypothetical protein